MNTFQVLANQVPNEGHLFCVGIPSKKNTIYVQLFNSSDSSSKNEFSEPMCLSLDEWTNFITKIESKLTVYGCLEREFIESLDSNSYVSFNEMNLRCSTLADFVTTCLDNKENSMHKIIKPYYFHEPYIGIIKKNRKNV